MKKDENGDGEEDHRQQQQDNDAPHSLSFTVFHISLPVGDNEVGFGSRAVNFPIQVSVIITY